MACSTSSWGRIRANMYSVFRQATSRWELPRLTAVPVSAARSCNPDSSIRSMCCTRQSTICRLAVRRERGGSNTTLVLSSLSSFGLKSCGRRGMVRRSWEGRMIRSGVRWVA